MPKQLGEALVRAGIKIRRAGRSRRCSHPQDRCGHCSHSRLEHTYFRPARICVAPLCPCRRFEPKE